MLGFSITMPMRVLAILVFMLPAFRGVGALPSPHKLDYAHTQACCETIEISSCCTEQSLPEVCPHTGGDCSCLSNPSDLPKPIQAPVLPKSLGDLLSQIPETGGLLVWVYEPDHQVNPLMSRQGIFEHSTHNQVQSVLGVWSM